MSNDTPNLAVFCDFENVALGVRDANFKKFDIRKVLERLLLKGSIVVKKAYSDWERYKAFKPAMHEAAFELIEIPHVRQSGKNSADIRLVVDALDLCYTKSHVNTFVIVSGDSDFSPLVSKLRENNKQVIGVGVANSSSDLLIANCDEFIYYDDLVREKPKRKTAQKPTRRKPAARSSASAATGEAELPPEAEAEPAPETETDTATATATERGLELLMETIEALFDERDEQQKVWGSMVKQTLRRRQPGFNESAFGFRSFSDMLEAAQKEGLITLEKDDKSGGYVILSYQRAD